MTREHVLLIIIALLCIAFIIKFCVANATEVKEDPDLEDMKYNAFYIKNPNEGIICDDKGNRIIFNKKEAKEIAVNHPFWEFSTIEEPLKWEFASTTFNVYES